MEDIVNGFDFGDLPINVKYVGKTRRENWDCDQWLVEFFDANTRNITWCTNYFTGLGLRKKTAHHPHTKPVMPKKSAIMHALLLDSEAADMSFLDWCAEFGFSDDSISAFNTYKQCCETDNNLRRIFNRAQIEQMREALRDY